MSSVHQWFVYVTLLLFASARSGSCLTCYACTEEKDGICRALNDAKEATEVCRNYQVCVKHTLAPVYWSPGRAKEITERFCADDNYCEVGMYLTEHKHRLKTKKCTTCRRSHCNSATSLEISSFIITVLSVKHYLLTV